jgi:hypothetical protein
MGRREICDNANKDRWKGQGEIGVWAGKCGSQVVRCPWRKTEERPGEGGK